MSMRGPGRVAPALSSHSTRILWVSLLRMTPLKTSARAFGICWAHSSRISSRGHQDPLDAVHCGYAAHCAASRLLNLR